MHPADAVDCTHDQLVQMTAHQQLCLLAKEHLENRPNHFNDCLLDLKYLAHFGYRLSHQMQYSCKEHIVSPHYQLVLFLPSCFLVDAANMVGVLLLHLVLNYLAHTRVLSPAQALDYMPLKGCEVVSHLARHQVVKAEERLKSAPQIECVQFECLQDVWKLDVLARLEQVQFCGEHHDRLLEYCVLQDLSDVANGVVGFLLFFEKHFFYNSAAECKNYLCFLFAEIQVLD